jgi:F0F1-type ATP synthase epsilon subunit
MINLQIITPENEIINHKKVNYIHVTLSDGNPISIYPLHAPLIAALGEGKLIYKDDNKSRVISISDGFMHVNKNIVKCFLEWAVKTAENYNNETG